MIRINLLGDALTQASGKKAERGEPAQVYGQDQEVSRSSFPILGVIISLLFVAVGVVYYVYLDRQVEEQVVRKEDLERQKRELEPYAKLEAKFRKDKELIERKKAVIKDLRLNQHSTVHILEEVANALPDDVWFREITQKGLSVTVSGESNSFEAINQFRTRLMDQKNWFGNVNYPTATKKGSVIEFTLSFDVKKQS